MWPVEVASQTQKAVGRPVTLHLRDGRQFHGVLVARWAKTFELRVSSGKVRVFEQGDVDRMQVREHVSA